MLLTLFTPTHDVRFLPRLARSLAAQTARDFEWLVVPNGPVTAAEVASVVPAPPPRSVPYTGESRNIGAIKHFACLQARGDVLVEVDHDDELTPDCVAELLHAFAGGRTDFVYSNCCEVTPDGRPATYDPAFGWRYRDFAYQGRVLKECRAFPPTPVSFSKVWYAPNHVRAWRKDFYERVGGHDPTLAVLDDHDLLCRTYVHGSVKHLDRCLYIYHYHGGNTSKDTGGTNQAIQTGTLDLHDRYVYALVEKWCSLHGLARIDLCGGDRPAPGYLSVDRRHGHVRADLDRPWPFADGRVGVFRAHDALEHLRDPVHTMKEVQRCLAPGGWLLSLTPSTDGRGAFQDPTHVSFWNSNSFWYYTRREQAGFIGTPVRFQLSRLKNFFPTPWHAEHNIVYVKADLVKLGLEPMPGLIEI